MFCNVLRQKLPAKHANNASPVPYRYTFMAIISYGYCKTIQSSNILEGRSPSSHNHYLSEAKIVQVQSQEELDSCYTRVASEASGSGAKLKASFEERSDEKVLLSEAKAYLFIRDRFPVVGNYRQFTRNFDKRTSTRYS